MCRSTENTFHCGYSQLQFENLGGKHPKKQNQISLFLITIETTCFGNLDFLHKVLCQILIDNPIWCSKECQNMRNKMTFIISQDFPKPKWTKKKLVPNKTLTNPSYQIPGPLPQQPRTKLVLFYTYSRFLDVGWETTQTFKKTSEHSKYHQPWEEKRKQDERKKRAKWWHKILNALCDATPHYNHDHQCCHRLRGGGKKKKESQYREAVRPFWIRN